MPQEIQVKSVLNKTKKRDPWFLDDYTVNPYSGCSFNCLYCYIRGSKYGTNMAEKTSVKVNALEVFEKQLHNWAKKGQYGIIVLSSSTDPYLHFERDYKLTRQFLELILKYKFPVHVITKSDLVVRDFDLLEKINRGAILPADLQGKLKHKAILTFSFSTFDANLAHIFEPGATEPDKRLYTLKEALKVNIFSGVSLMPLLPYINDTNEQLERILTELKSLGVNYVFQKYFPQFVEDYKKLFDEDSYALYNYQKMINRKLTMFCEKYQLSTKLIVE